MTVDQDDVAQGGINLLCPATLVFPPASLPPVAERLGFQETRPPAWETIHFRHDPFSTAT